ncbi:hypothetical protein B296_00021670 [Ensete ventricosum]|uniref:Uncharacterized protein n=1 Tax=Ensete ventricosum TaxID=4639 RepID=A0A426ZTB2_ENSVE|nr:hypothetical protein B296_00021670 [Ensete ventricosum]
MIQWLSTPKRDGFPWKQGTQRRWKQQGEHGKRLMMLATTESLPSSPPPSYQRSGTHATSTLFTAFKPMHTKVKSRVEHPQVTTPTMHLRWCTADRDHDATTITGFTGTRFFQKVV